MHESTAHLHKNSIPTTAVTDGVSVVDAARCCVCIAGSCNDFACSTAVADTVAVAAATQLHAQRHVLCASIDLWQSHQLCVVRRLQRSNRKLMVMIFAYVQICKAMTNPKAKFLTAVAS